MNEKLLNIMIDRGILSSVFYNFVKLETYLRPDLEEALNINFYTSAGVTKHKIFENINELINRDVVYLLDDSNKKQIANLNENMSLDNYLGLTSKGGLLCEEYFKINWNYYWNHELIDLNEIDEVIFSTPYKDYFKLVQKYLKFMGIHEFEIYKQPYLEILYWKRLENVYSIKFIVHKGENNTIPSNSEYFNNFPSLQWRRD